jgi:uncharacterized protein
MLLFFGVFFGIYLGMHLYVVYRIFGFFSLKRNWIFFAVAFGLALTFPLISIIEHYSFNIFTKLFYFISATWLGVLFILFFTLLIYEVVRLFVKIDPKNAGIMIIAFVLAISIVSMIFAFVPTVKRVEIPISGLDKEMKIVQISDVHLGVIHNKGFLKTVVEKTNKENPDLVLITGDLFDGADHVTIDTISPLDDIKAKTFFSVGNHEVYSGLPEKMQLLNKTKVKVLRNEIVEFDGVQIIGIDDPAAESMARELSSDNNILPKMHIDSTKTSILMYHPPSGLAESSAANISLQLSGHTHGGQIFPFNYAVKLVFPRNAGLYRYGNTWLYVSSGTGTWGPPMRFGSISEITSITLVPAK